MDLKTGFRMLSAAVFCVVADVAAAGTDNRPETWYHIIGGNVTKKGLTADLEALAAAGFGGIQFFHGQFGKAEAWDGVDEQIPCLSEKWDDLVVHAADECARLGMTFKMQNCPGWSMSGGPWISVSNAMRKLVYSRRDVPGGTVPADVPVPADCRDGDSDWHDVVYLAFPTPAWDDSSSALKPVKTETDGDSRVYGFASPVTVRTIELPPPRQLSSPWSYDTRKRIRFEAAEGDGWRTVLDVACPAGCWQDRVPMSFACEEAVAAKWRLTLTAPYELKLPYVRFSTAARFDNWEGMAGHVLRGRLVRKYPVQSRQAYIPSGGVRKVRPGDVLPARDGGWTVLRVGHVNMKKVNAPAPREATGWECDKLDPAGIEANFAGYIGRLVKGPLKGGKLKGMIVDSWECERQTWTWRMAEWFADANGYEVEKVLPAVFGWVVGSPAETDRMLLDWRRTLAGLVTRNYYGRMAELAHAHSLTVAYETSFGDVVPGDILEYWKYCDTPMCEFWQPYTPQSGGVGHPSYKPVRPCASAAHIYGKRRVDCESFTSMALTWDENFRDLKEQAVRYFAGGVTHLVFHTMTHNPHTDGRVPGTSFGSYIGTPFIRGQTWWPYMRSFAGWTAACTGFLERGMPVVDVLRYLGDAVDHKPDETGYFPYGFKNDYLNADVLFNRLDVRDGKLVLPDGMTYRVIWVPEETALLPKTKKRLDELAAKGARVVYGSADDSVAGLEPRIVSGDRLYWYQRVDGGSDCFFTAATDRGFSGEVRFRTRRGVKTFFLELAPYETLLLEFSESGVKDLAPGSRWPRVTRREVRELPVKFTDWTLSFPSGWGAPAKIALEKPVAWKDIPGADAETRAFSGTAAYECVFSLPELPAGGLELDLGEVRDFARVYVNGREAAELWARPYGCDVSSLAKKGENRLRIEVTSTWFNRLAYDFSLPPEKRRTWTVWKIHGSKIPCLQRGAQLRDSGLIGPVKIVY